MGERKMDVVIKMEGEWEYWWVRMTDRRRREGEKTAKGKGERQVKGQIIPEIVNQSALQHWNYGKRQTGFLCEDGGYQIGMCKTK